ncbi:MAG: hypothetical protein ACKO1O_04720 [Erythrobacter sp.]
MRRSLAAALALSAATPLAAQQSREPVIFTREVFDITGAGTLEIGSLDPVLQPFRETFGGFGGVAADLTLGPDGKVTACTPDRSDNRPEAAQALCAHVLKVGRFRRDPAITLDYEQATYRLSVWYLEGRRGENGEEFQIDEGYPLERTRVRFGEVELPPEDLRLTLADLDYKPMEYPRSALRSEIRAAVVVVLGFDAEGAVASCRPVESSNTARMAYETCKAASGSFRLKNTPDARPFVLSIAWSIP